MNKIKIVADSCCDLTAELVAKHDIAVLPLYVALGDTAASLVVLQHAMEKFPQ